MKPYPPITSLPEVLNFLKTIVRLRADDVKEINNLNTRFVQGRLRTDRAAPSAFSDVVGGDQLGDIVRDGSYQYTVVNDSGTLKWARHALDVGW